MIKRSDMRHLGLSFAKSKSNILLATANQIPEADASPI